MNEKLKFIEDIHIDEIDKQIEIRRNLIKEMLGQLYSSILHDEIQRLQKRKEKRKQKDFIKEAVKEAVEEMIEIPEDEFQAKLKEHENGDIAKALLYSNANIMYTGFSTRCKKCGVDVKSKYLGKTKKGIPSYELYCKCPVNKESSPRKGK